MKVVDAFSEHHRARLLDMVAGRSAAAMFAWLDTRTQFFRDRVEVVSLDGFAGYHRLLRSRYPRRRR